MKLLHVICCILLLNVVAGSWLGDVFTGLNEAAEDFDLKKDLKKIGEKVKDVLGKNLTDTVIAALPGPDKIDWVKETKKYLTKLKFKDILEATSNVKMEDLVDKWNNVLKELNNQDQFKSTKVMYQKINKDIKDLLPEKLYKKWKKQTHSIAKKLNNAAKNVKKAAKNINLDAIKYLKDNVKNWKQPSFMDKEDIEEEKQMIRDAVDAVNKKLKEGGKLLKVVPLLKLTAAKKLTDKKEEEEAKVEKWLKKKFTKPHHMSGHSKWEDIMEKIPVHKFQKLPLKNLKKKFKKLIKKHKKVLVVKEPVKTDVKVLNGKDFPIFISDEDSKKLESLTPKEKKEYEKAEAKWEMKVLKEAQRLVKKMRFAEIEGHKAAKTTAAPTTMKPTEKPKGVMTGNENWDKIEHKKMVTKDDPWDDYDEDDKMLQSTKSKLSKKDFIKKLADEEGEWFNIKKQLFSKMKKIRV